MLLASQDGSTPPRFLQSPPRFLFFTGKGGVGKTSLACASAVRLADAGARVLLVSTDPASNVGQVLGVSIGNQVTTIQSVPRLAALEIDPAAAAQEYRDRMVGPVRGVLPDAVVKGMEEQLSGACTTEIAAFDEFTALLLDGPLTAEYDHIVFDTAPTGHTIRLLQLPGAWTGFLEQGKGDASCLGPLAGLEKQRAQYKEAVDALADPARTRMVLVARGQPAALDEVERTRAELLGIGLRHQHLVVNGVLPAEEGVTDPIAAAIIARESDAVQHLPEALRSLPRDIVTLRPYNLVGIAALRALLGGGEPDAVPDEVATTPAEADSLASLVDEIETDGHGLVMVMGKGGVGKTTVAAAVAVALAQRGHAVHLTTSDPAGQLANTLDGNVEGLKVSRIDPAVETARYREQVLATKGKSLDAEGRALLEEDLRSPCTEEIAVFRAFAGAIHEASRSFVVLDTAPTGHTLLLLDATGAYHRDLVRKMANGTARYRTPMMQLQDPAYTKVIVVTLAETTPVLEAAALQAELRRAGIEPWAWVVNNSLSAANPTSPILRARAAAEQAEIERVQHDHAGRLAIIPFQAETPVGVERLAALASLPVGSGTGMGRR
ncbi:MAG: arsenical pump-driving ATPase [Gemmatimonadota bacterium]